MASEPALGSPQERRQALEHVRQSWRATLGESECEDAVSEAYVALLDHIEREDPPENRIGWLKATAWQIANTTYRRIKFRATDSVNGNIDAFPAPTALPEDEVEIVDVDGRLREAFRQLPEEVQQALASEFAEGLSVKAACKRLRCPRSTLLHRRVQARRYLYAAALAANERFDEVVMAMMTACLSGAATEEQRRRVCELRERSPYYAAKFAELRALDERLPAIVPPLALAHGTLVDRAAAAMEKLRDAVHGLITRNPDTTDTATSPALANSGAGKTAGATAGGLGGALSGLGGAKIVAGCITGAAAGACVAAVGFGVGVPGLGGHNAGKPAAMHEAAAESRPHSPPPTPAPRTLPSQIAHDTASQPAPPPPSRPSSTKPANDPKPKSDPKPQPAQSTSSSDFSYSTDTSAPSTSSAPRVPTSSPTPNSSGTSSGGGGSGGSSNGDFAFGGP